MAAQKRTVWRWGAGRALAQFYRHIPLTPKMLFFTVMAGIVLWALHDQFENRRLRDILYAQQMERLKGEAQESRIRFDNSVTAYNQAAKLFVSLTQFTHYLERNEASLADSRTPIVFHDTIPPWLPDASVLRKFARVYYAFLLNRENQVREVYQGWPEPVPDSLLHQDNLQQLLSTNQSYMTNIAGVPFVLTAESVEGPNGGKMATLMFASPLDNDFLEYSQGGAYQKNIVALFNSDNYQLIASNRPELFPIGMTLNLIEEEYIVTGKSFFDHGASDLMVQFATLIAKEEYANLSKSILAAERKQRAISAAVLILCFSLIMLKITASIRSLTLDIINFSEKTFGATAAHANRGDEIQTLRERFHHLTNEIIVYRDSLAHEKLKLEESQSNLKEMMYILDIQHKELNIAYNELKSTQSQMLQREKMASIGQLAAGVAHEINNPMGFIISNFSSLGKYVSRLAEFINAQSAIIKSIDTTEPIAELEKKRKKLKLDYILSDAYQLLAESLEGAERVKKIVQNLKNFSRLDESEIKPADINAGLESTLNIASNELKYKATVKEEYGDIPLTLCNLGQLNQVFLNILVNAAHAIEKQGEITIKTLAQDDFIEVIIADNGKGIPPDTIPRIFEPFFTTKEIGAGTGLGLSIAYDIVKKHQGDITVVSELGKGTTFTVKIPITKAESGAA